MFYSKKLNKLLRKIPGERIFGSYRFLPLFFIFGASVEFVMIKLRVGEVNFYDTFKRKEVQRLVEQRLNEESAAQSCQ